MKVQHKAMILTIITIMIFTITIVSNQYIALKSKKLFLDAHKSTLKHTLEQILSTKSEKFLLMVNDNSAWDDMVSFCEKQDSSFAIDNIDYMIEAFHLNFLTIYDSTYLPYYKVQNPLDSCGDFTIPNQTLKQIFTKSAFAHFFVMKKNNLVEICGAKIVPSSDIETRKEKGVGYLFIGKHWDSKYVNDMQNASDQKLYILPPDSVLKVDKEFELNFILTKLELKDSAKKNAAILHFIGKNPIASDLNAMNKLSLIIVIVSVTTFLVFFIGFRKIVSTPLKQVSQSLDNQNISNLTKIKNQKDEFGQLSELIIKFFDKKNAITIANASLQQQKEEILVQNEMLHEKQKEIEDKNEQITSSILYAKNIQKAVLQASLSEITEIEYFLLNRPRDIVSGDYIWAHQENEQLLFAVADCTGHGVPGAFMSLLGITLLSEIAHRQDIRHPNEVLNFLRFEIKKLLGQTGKVGEQKDGMDMVFCSLNTQTLDFEYAGAYNPVYLIRNSEITEYKTDRMPVGIYHSNEKDFTNYSLKLQKNDILYLATDGYEDQFGGKDTTKFMAKQLKNLLVNISKEEMEKQKEILEKTFDDWIGKQRQTDDVTVLCLKI